MRTVCCFSCYGLFLYYKHEKIVLANYLASLLNLQYFCWSVHDSAAFDLFQMLHPGVRFYSVSRLIVVSEFSPADKWQIAL